MAGNGQKLTRLRQRVFKMVSVGVVDDRINQGYDAISTGLLLLNLIGAFAGTFDSYAAKYGVLLHHIESVTVAFFALDYVLRMYTAPCLYPDEHGARPYMRYALSGAGIIDLMSFLPYYLPMFFPAGTDVIVGKSQQLLSSVFIIFVLMLASSLAMYSIEHEAQPDVFKNAFSGIWWSVSTLLTVGYGDIYPITPLGKAFGILITFLGVGMVAIPTGIISAGFVEQYSRLQRISDYAKEENLHFVKIELSSADDWNGKQIMDLHLPHGMIVAVIQRGRDIIVPRGDVVLKTGDKLVLGAEALKGDHPVNLKEITLLKNHDWNDTAIKDLDISRQTYIVMVRRDGVAIVPSGSLVLRQGDVVILYTKEHLANEEVLSV